MADYKKMPYVVGITGGIASGKTTVGDILKRLGAYIIDADIVSREVAAPGTECEVQLRAAFPEAFGFDGLNRGKLREIVFASDEARATLNAITHPAIEAELKKRIAAAPVATVFVIVPLLFETGMDEMCDYVVTVSASEDLRIKRLIRRNNISEALAKNMLRAQADESERVSRADEVLVNNGGTDELEGSVAALYERLTCK